MKIFISYRRQDSQWAANNLKTATRAYVRREQDVFMDVHDIPPGVDFPTHLDQQVSRCQVLFALIGPKWLDIRDDSGRRRLDDPNDFVRLEIASALRRKIRVVPILLDGAAMPRPDELPNDLKQLHRCNAVEMRLQSFESDIDRTLRKLGLSKGASTRRALLAAGVVGAAGVGVGVYGYRSGWFGVGPQLTLPPNVANIVDLAQDASRTAIAAINSAIQESNLAKDNRDEAQTGEDPQRFETSDYFAGLRRAPDRPASGVFASATGGRYEGQWLGYEYHGFGVFRPREDDEVDASWGRFNEGKLTGSGKVDYANGSSYQGALRARVPNGMGVLTRSDNSQLVGEFVDGLPHGVVVEFRDNAPLPGWHWVNGERADATPDAQQAPEPLQLREDVAAAVAEAEVAETEAVNSAERGRQAAMLAQEFYVRAEALHRTQQLPPDLDYYEYSDGSRYVGQLRTFMGALGVYTFGEGPFAGTQYAGTFQGDRLIPRMGNFAGFGVLTATVDDGSGRVAAGQFARSRVNGHGEVEYADGRIYRGEITSSQATGRGVMRSPDGSKSAGAFVEGRFVLGAHYDAAGVLVAQT